MKERTYKRVDLARLRDPGMSENLDVSADTASPQSARVRIWIIPLSIFLCCLQAALTIVADNVYAITPTSTLISVIAFATLFGLVLGVNPLLALLEKRSFSRRLNRIELVCIFTAMLVTSGFSTFGLAAHVVPLIPAPWNPQWNTPQRGWDVTLTAPDEPVLNPGLYLQDPHAIRLFREGGLAMPPPEGSGLRAQFGYFDEVFEKIPWGQWAGPVGLWLVFVFGCFGIFYSLAYVVLGFWSGREKLIFPLAQLSASVLPGGEEKRALPAIFYRPGFWIGFSLSAMVLSWNAAIEAGWIVSNFRIALGLGPNETVAMFEGGILQGLAGSRTSIRFLLIFTAIGIAFLLPVQISFSTWSYYLIGQFMLLVAVWIGIGQNLGDFPADFVSTGNFLTSQGGGALLTFAAISLGRCLREYYTLSKSKTASERVRIALPVLLLAASIAVVVMWLVWNRVSWLWALTFVLFLTLLTVGMMRIVAETGIYWFQPNFGFFHMFNAFGIGKLVSGAMFAPLMPVYSIFFMDMKTFAAPNLLNAAKLQHDSGEGRRMFHWNLILCIILSTVFAIGFMIFLAHERGAQQMEPWFFGSMPVGTLNNAHSLIVSTAQGFSANGIWFVIGGAWLAASLWLRQSFFWFPHPIGFILLFNPLMSSLWFSFFLGWVFKRITVSYGGKATFDRVRPVFIGLIFGELIAIFAWMIAGLIFGFQPGIDLNRYGA